MRRAFARVSTYPWRRHRREPQRRKPCFSACVRRAMPRQPWRRPKTALGIFLAASPP